MHLFSLHYFPQVKYLGGLLQADAICFEAGEHFQRQTYRNRCEIYTANGMHKLIVPVHHSPGNLSRLTVKDTRISYADPWPTLHLRTIQTAYRSSSFYEYFEDEFNRIFSLKYEFLFNFNLACLEMIFKFLNTPFHYALSSEYRKIPENQTDLREAFSSNKYELNFEYHQVFRAKHGFIGNLSILDLLFNAGPERSKELLMRVELG